MASIMLITIGGPDRSLILRRLREVSRLGDNGVAPEWFGDNPLEWGQTVAKLCGEAADLIERDGSGGNGL
jgi:hypothetical protein